NALRTVFGATFGTSVSFVDAQFYAGWSHELADTARPVTASFAGAPAFGFTVQGAAAPRDGAVLGFSANAKIADSTTLFARYDGEDRVLDAALRPLRRGYRGRHDQPPLRGRRQDDVVILRPSRDASPATASPFRRRAPRETASAP